MPKMKTNSGSKKRFTPVSYTHLDVYKRQIFLYWICRSWESPPNIMKQ